MKLGISSWALAWNIGVPGHEPTAAMDAHALLRYASDHGLRVVQIADNLPLERLSGEALRAVCEDARERGIAVEIGTRGIDPEHLRRMLAICTMFASPILRVVVDTAAHHPSADEIVSTFVSLQADFTAAGVIPAIENHDRFDSQAFVQMIKRIGRQRSGICLDTVNSFGALEGPGIVIDTLAPYTVNLHLKDFVIRRHPSMMGFEIIGAPAGQGRLNVPELLARVRNDGRDANAILEQWPPLLGSVAETAAMELEWAESSIRYLRTLIKD